MTRTADGTLELRTDRPTELVHELTGWAIAAGFALEDLSVSRPTLEDAYLGLVGPDGHGDEAAAPGASGDRPSRRGRR